MLVIDPEVCPGRNVSAGERCSPLHPLHILATKEKSMSDYSSISFKNNGKLKLLIIVGTRPEIIRLAAVINKTLGEQ